MNLGNILGKIRPRKTLVYIAILAIALASLAHYSLSASTPLIMKQAPPEQYGLGLLAAAIAVAGSCVAAGIAIYGAATAGSAAMAERPEISIWVIILAGLGEGVAIYGLLIAIMILGKL